MGPGNRHEDEPLDEHHEGGDGSPDAELDDDLADRPRGRLPDPLDRVWLHPTELSVLGSFAPRPAASGTRHRSSAWLTPVLAGAAGALLTVAVLAVSGVFDSAPATGRGAAAATDATTARVTSATDAVARLGPSVVAVVAKDAKGTRRGSGVCVRHGAQVLTSIDVVGTATTVDVTTADGEQHPASVAGRDRVTGLVLLDLPGDSDVPAAQLADRAPATGTAVWLLGAPAKGATAPWMSSGMTSSDNAMVWSTPGPTTGGLLETDAASSATTTGGALVDATGSVAGIVLGHVNGSSSTYAVSIEVAVAIAQQLDATGVAEHGNLGVDGVDTRFGPMIVEMPRNGPAARAGVRVRDLVESVDGRAVASIGEMTAVAQSLDPGRTVVVELRRGKKALAVRVRLGATSG